jgi:hypothetical protein
MSVTIIILGVLALVSTLGFIANLTKRK